jgi:hypothetical protein
MTDSTGPVKPRLSAENPSSRADRADRADRLDLVDLVDLDQPSWQLSQALVRGDLKPMVFLTGRDSGDVRPARSAPRSDSPRVIALAVGVTAVGAFLGGAYLLFRRNEAAPGALSGLAAFALAMQALWYRMRR